MDTTSLANRVAAAIWAVSQASPIAGQGKGLSWDDLNEIAERSPDNPTRTMRDVTLAEARAAIGVVFSVVTTQFRSQPAADTDDRFRLGTIHE